MKPSWPRTFLSVATIAAILVVGALSSSRTLQPNAERRATPASNSPTSMTSAATDSTAMPELVAPDPFAELERLAFNDPALAIERAHALGRTAAEKAAWVARLARAWTARDPQAAWDWLARLDQPKIHALADGTLPEVIIGAIAQHAPTLLVRNLDVALRAGESPLGVPAVVAVHLGLEALVANHQLDLARQSIETWVAEPQQLSLGEGAFVAVALALSQSGFAEAGRWLKSLPASSDRDIALVELPAHWVQSDARLALDWIDREAPPELRAAARRRAFNEWVEMSPADAGEWLGGYLAKAPADADTDRMIATVVNLGYALKSNPATALAWVGLVSDATARATLEERVVLRWARQDREAAGAYLAQVSALPFERKQALLQQMQGASFAARED